MDSYRDLIQTVPALFSNPPGEGIIILLEDTQIAEAEAAVARHLARNEQDLESARVGVVFNDPYWTILRDAVRFLDGRLGTYIRLVRKPHGASTVAILPVWNDRVLLLRNFRHAVRDWRLEIPRGFAEPGQTPAENARRELLEEVGGSIVDLLPLGGLEADSGVTNDRTELFLAHLDGYGAGARDEGIVEIIALPIDDLERMIRDDEITDSFTISALARARLRRLI